MPDIEKVEAELRAGLDGVTPGPWKPFVMNGVRAVMKDDRELIKWTGFDASDYPEAAAKNARHIARCDPDTIRLLLDELSRYREAEKRYREALEAATELERAGVMLANAAFNIDQMGAENVGAQHIRSLKSSQVEWDTAAVVFARARRALQESVNG
jgi:hypothetical protein